MTIQFKAKKQGYYRVLVDDVEVSKHITERDALESASNQIENGQEFKVIPDYEVLVEDPDRRKFLGAAVACATSPLLLAACGSEDSDTATTTYTSAGTNDTNPGTGQDRDMLVGINGGFNANWGNTQFLNNLVKNGNVQGWPSNTRDANDYPIDNISGELNIVILQNYIDGGNYYVRWSGTTSPANVTLTPNTGIVSSSSNEKVFSIAPTSTGILSLIIGAGGTLTSDNGGLQVFHENDLARVNTGQVVTQQYVDAYSGVNHWRGYWATNASSSSVITFNELNPQDRLTWSYSNVSGSTNPGDVALETIAKIANEVANGNLYYPLPSKGDNDCWRQICEYFAANLNGKLYLTVGNEIWNTFAEFGDNTRWYELGRDVPGFEVTIASTGPAIASDPGHSLSNGDTINLFARQHETDPYVWGGIAGDVANDMFTVTNVTTDTWQLANHNYVPLSDIGVSELYYKQRNGNVGLAFVQGIDMTQMRQNYADALLIAWGLADTAMGRSRAVHVADMGIGLPATLTDMQAVPGFNEQVDYVFGNVYANIFASGSASKTDAQIMADAVANMDETTFDTVGYWIADAYTTLKAASPNAKLGSYEGDEGSNHVYGLSQSFLEAWKKRDSGGGTFAPWYWQRLADLGITLHTHFMDSGNWNGNVAGIRENPGDDITNNAYFRKWRAMMDEGGGVSKS